MPTGIASGVRPESAAHAGLVGIANTARASPATQRQWLECGRGQLVSGWRVAVGETVILLQLPLP